MTFQDIDFRDSTSDRTYITLFIDDAWRTLARIRCDNITIDYSSVRAPRISSSRFGFDAEGIALSCEDPSKLYYKGTLLFSSFREMMESIHGTPYDVSFLPFYRLSFRLNIRVLKQ